MTTNFGVRNELRAVERKRKEERIGIAVTLACLALIAAMALAQYLDGVIR